MWYCSYDLSRAARALSVYYIRHNFRSRDKKIFQWCAVYFFFSRFSWSKQQQWNDFWRIFSFDWLIFVESFSKYFMVVFNSIRPISEYFFVLYLSFPVRTFFVVLLVISVYFRRIPNDYLHITQILGQLYLCKAYDNRHSFIV